ncbi:MAG TPA: helix-turn-helix transcriptional regulator [Nevskia sp.]|nr:helix-turn-helix transcriptional regulator [Nevskia sp.]
MTRLGKMIRMFRQVQDVEQKALAAQIGLTPAQLSRLENGRGELDGADLVKVMAWLVAEAPQAGRPPPESPQQSLIA